MDVARPAAHARAVPAAPRASVAARLFAHVVVPPVVAVAAIGLTGWLLIVDPVRAMQAAIVVATPCVLVWLSRERY